MEKKNTNFLQKIEKIRLSVNWGYLVHEKLGNTASWFQERRNGQTENGEYIEFSSDEIQALKNMLFELSSDIKEVAENL